MRYMPGDSETQPPAAAASAEHAPGFTNVAMPGAVHSLSVKMVVTEK